MLEHLQKKTWYQRLSLAGLWRTILLGLKSLWLHRLRSLLTVLGIVFGVCSVIAMLAVGEGASYEAQEQIRRLGSNNIILRSVKPSGTESTSTQRSYVLQYGLTYQDIRRIRDSIPAIELVVPGRLIRKEVWYGTKRQEVEILGTVPWYPEMRQLAVTAGRYFSAFEMEDRSNVAVLGAGLVADLFPFGDPVGRKVRVAGDYYRIIGVVEDDYSGEQLDGGDGGSGINGHTATAKRMYIPLSAARSRFGEVLIKRQSGSFEAERVELHEVTVKVDRQERVQEVARIISELLERYHKKLDYQIVVPLELLRQAERTKQIFNIVLGAIAAISLLVGGIGIMNIMLASVTERTREIGIRRALGAKKRDIIIQFLVETVILSASGGIIGVILGVMIPFLITYFADMITIVTPMAPILAFSISALVGIVFGIYPALRAANMDPVEALRHE